ARRAPVAPAAEGCERREAPRCRRARTRAGRERRRRESRPRRGRRRSGGRAVNGRGADAPGPGPRTVPAKPEVESSADVAARYRRDAEAYRELWAPVLRDPSRRIVRELADPAARAVLDVGSGVGTLLPDLAAAFPAARVTAIDHARGM